MKYATVTFFVVWMLIMWVGVIYALRMGLRSFRKDWRGEKTRVRAKVVGKNEQMVYVPLIHDQEHVRELVFECPDGKTVAHQVPERLFLHVSEGQEGVLVCQGDRFVAFEGPSGASEGEDDIYRRLIRG